MGALTEITLPGEIIPPSDRSVRLVAALRPFELGAVDRRVAAGHSLLELVALTDPPLNLASLIHVAIDDLAIPRELWQRVRPKPGTTVTVRVVPGKSGKKNPLRFILQMIVMIASVVMMAIPGLQGIAFLGLTWGTVLGAAVGLVGGLIVNALIPPPKPKLNDLNGSQRDSPTLSIQGTQNQARPYGKVPRMFGRHRIVPAYGALPYTELRGSDQFLVLLFDCGYGPLELTALKIGETPLENYEGFEVVIRQGFPDDPPLTLYPFDTFEDPEQILLDNASGWVVRVSKPDTTRLSVDYTFASGLTQFDDEGDRKSLSVELAVEYRLVGAAGWTAFTAPVAHGARTTAALKRPKGGGKQGDDNEIGGKRAVRPLTYRISLHPETGAISVASGTGNIGIPTRNLAVARVLLSSDTAVPGELADERSAAMIAAGHFAPVLNGNLSVTLGAGTVTPASFIVTDNSTAAVRVNRNWPVESGQWEVRSMRVSADTDDDQIFDKAFWTALRSFGSRQPIVEPGHATIELVIKATNELNGIVDQFNCIAHSLLWDFDGTEWSLQPSATPAAIYVEMLRGPATRRPVLDDRIYWPAFEDWAAKTRAAGREFNAVIDFGTTVFEALKMVAAVGRANFHMEGHRYSIIIDEPQAVPMQQFTPRNSWGFRWRKTFVDLPHALKVRFINRDTNWLEDERIVYADGFDELTATKFETLDMFAVTDAAQIWNDGRYHQAVGVLRPEDIQLNADVEHIVAKRGKLVAVQHDVILVGIASGRIKTVTLDGGGQATQITVDEACPMEPGVDYGVKMRTVNNIKVIGRVNTVAGDQTVLVFTTPIAPNLVPEAGDVFSFGELGRETSEYIVKSVLPFSDLAATLTFVDAAPAIFTADQGPIPPYDSNITVPIPPNGRPPARPSVIAIRSDEAVLLRHSDGALESRILVTLSFASGTAETAERIEAVFRRSDSTGAWDRVASLQGDASQIAISPVQDKVEYDIWIRAVSRREAFSDWTKIKHRVIGKSTLPPDVPGLMRELGGLVWPYPAPPRDMDGFELKANAGNNRKWETAARLHDEIIRATNFPIERTGQGLRTVLVKAVDVAGNRSANAAAIVLGLGDPIVENLVTVIDFQALAYPGTVENGSLIGGRLRADDNGELFWKADDQAPFWNADDDAPFWQVTYKQMRYVATVAPAPEDVPANLRIVADVIAPSFQIAYRPTGSQAPFWDADDAPFWGPDGDPFWDPAPGFMPWPGEVPVTHESYELRVTTAPGAAQGQLSAFQALIDMPDIEEEIDDLAVAAIGTRLPLARTYRKIVNLQLTLQSDGGAAATARAMDKDAALGPLVKCFDGANPPVATTGLIDARVQGY